MGIIKQAHGQKTTHGREIEEIVSWGERHVTCDHCTHIADKSPHELHFNLKFSLQLHIIFFFFLIIENK